MLIDGSENRSPTTALPVTASVSIIFRYVRVLILGQSGTPVPTTKFRLTPRPHFCILSQPFKKTYERSGKFPYFIDFKALLEYNIMNIYLQFQNYHITPRKAKKL